MIEMLMCRRCVDAIRSRGEEVFTRPLSFADMEELDPVDEEAYRCEWCEEEYTDSELVIAEF